jgi:hypothetical protein
MTKITPNEEIWPLTENIAILRDWPRLGSAMTIPGRTADEIREYARLLLTAPAFNQGVRADKRRARLGLQVSRLRAAAATKARKP